MSTLDGPIWSKCSIALTCPPPPPKSHGARVRMNVTTHQEKEKNEETKTGKRKTGEKNKRKQATDFEEAVSCPFAVVQGQHSEKMKGSAQGTWNPREGQHPF